jgi:hypothetical protein
MDQGKVSLVKPERRGTPPGAATMDAKALGGRGGRIGNPAHVYDPAKAAEIRTLAKVASQEMCAAQVGISVDVLHDYYLDDFNKGKREAVAAVGSLCLQKALAGNPTMIIFYLRTQGKWTTRLELSGPGGGPLRHVDLTSILAGKTEEELAIIEPILEQLLASLGGAGEPGGYLLGPPTGEGPAGPA